MFGFLKMNLIEGFELWWFVESIEYCGGALGMRSLF
jgi:hypothetical protein